MSQSSLENSNSQFFFVAVVVWLLVFKLKLAKITLVFVICLEAKTEKMS